MNPSLVIGYKSQFSDFPEMTFFGKIGKIFLSFRKAKYVYIIWKIGVNGDRGLVAVEAKLG